MSTLYKSGLRKIKNGKVKFFGRYYSPAEWKYPYDGQLDETKWFFISYPNDVKPPRLAMWGSERTYNASKNKNEEEYEHYYYEHPDDNIIDGKIYWYLWEEVENDSRREN